MLSIFSISCNKTIHLGSHIHVMVFLKISGNLVVLFLFRGQGMQCVSCSVSLLLLLTHISHR